jgi:ElaB/YqjD/DUF883 family membrane-anchored ribosome-binding protein
MSNLKKVYDKIALFVREILSSTRGRLEYIWFRVRTGEEPIVVRGIVVLIVAVAAMFGQIIDPNVVLAVIIFLVPAAISARGQVSPSETKFSWVQRVKDMFLEAPLQEGYTGNSVDPDAVEPNWSEEYENVTDEFEDLYNKYLEEAGDLIDDAKVVVDDVVAQVEDAAEDAVDQVEDAIDQAEDVAEDLEDEWNRALAGDE